MSDTDEGRTVRARLASPEAGETPAPLANLVERLRAFGFNAWCDGEAADAIERLEAAMTTMGRVHQDLEEDIDKIHKRWADEADALTRERTQLKAKIEGLAEQYDMALIHFHEEVATKDAEIERRVADLRKMDAAYLKLREFVLLLADYEDSYDPMQLQEMALAALEGK